MNAFCVLLSIIYSLLPVFSRVALAEDMDLEKIVVTASKIEQTYRHSTRNISIITRKDLKSTPIDEVTEMLDLLPSVDIIEYGSTGSTRAVHTRGASSSQVLTLIDGRPVNTPRDGQADFNQIPLSNIERIEVLRGPASSMYGANAVGGVINIITRQGSEKMQTETYSKFGSFATKHASITNGYKIKDFDYFIAYDYFAFHGHRDHADYLSNNVNTKFGYQLDKDNRIAVSSGYYNSEANTPGEVTSQDLDDRQEAFKRYVDLTYTGKLAEGQSIFLKTFHALDRLEFTEEFDPFLGMRVDKSTHQTKVYGLDAQLSQVFLSIFRTALGTTFVENRLNSSSSGKHTYNAKGIYFESEVDVFKQGTAKFGARWDDYSNFGDRISPSASYEFWLFDTVKFHALAAKSFRAPTFNDLYWPDEGWAVGNPNLTPEKAISYEAGISGYFLNRFKTDVTLFKTKFKDLIEWAPNADQTVWRPQNVNSAITKGVELEMEFKVFEKLRSNFNYTYLESKDTGTKKWLIYRPRHLYKLRLMYSPIPKLELALTTIYKTKRFVNPGNTRFLKHSCVPNLGISYKLNETATLDFEIKNIFDRDFQEEFGYSMPGRAFYGGLKLAF